jgi:dipeptide/tripeptide permease
MEKILGYTALQAGLGMLPMLGTFAVVAFLSDRVSGRLGMRAVIIAGTAMLAAGPLALSAFGTTSEYLTLVPGLVLIGIGAGLFYPTATTAAVNMLDKSRSSLAGGITYMFQVAGGAVGLGLTTAIFTIRSEDSVTAAAAEEGLKMTDSQAGVIHGLLAGTDSGQAALAQYSGSVADRIVAVVSDSFVNGVQLSFRVVAAIAVLGLVVAVVGVRPPDTRAEAGPAA